MAKRRNPDEGVVRAAERWVSQGNSVPDDGDDAMFAAWEAFRHDGDATALVDLGTLRESLEVLH